MDKEIIVVDESHCPVKWKKKEDYPEQQKCALCRCGNSSKKPHCDGSHLKGFDGTETASKKPYIKQADKLEGPGLIMTDASDLCSAARFCHRSLGAWKLTEKSNNPKNKEIAIQECQDCPSGRLVAWDKKTKKPIEPDFKPSISIVEDPDKKVSGPLWIKGGIPIESSDGKEYEKRNRVTLCRCGHSSNKPFCDGSHINSEFNDGDDSLK
jgi:CDGSH-type Zn-finger protein